jgi:hypothetical protein
MDRAVFPAAHADHRRYRIYRLYPCSSASFAGNSEFRNRTPDPRTFPANHANARGCRTERRSPNQCKSGLFEQEESRDRSELATRGAKRTKFPIRSCAGYGAVDSFYRRPRRKRRVWRRLFSPPVSGHRLPWIRSPRPMLRCGPARHADNPWFNGSDFCFYHGRHGMH